MKTIGKILKEARIRKRLSKEKLEKETKIKKEFIDFIEKEAWSKLPAFPVVQGFVKSIAQTLGVEEAKALALLRRDYPPRKLDINPKPDISDKFVWSPKVTFVAGITIVSLIILGYLGYEYYQFVSPPPLIVDTPKEGQVVDESLIQVSGKTDPDATVKVNNQPVLIKETGDFTIEIEISQETKEIVVKAISRSGKETTIRRKINPELD
jgi:cytoskeletal protein RodZ